MTSERDQNFLVETANGDRIVLKIANALEEPSMLEAQRRAMMHLAPAALGQADVAANPA